MNLGKTYKRVFASFLLIFYSKLWTSTVVVLYMSNAFVNGCHSDYNVTFESISNRTSIGKAIVSSKVIGPKMCVRGCLKRNCHSVYYNTATLECELNSRDHQNLQVGGAVQEYSNFSFINVSLASNVEGVVPQSSAMNHSQDNYVCITLKSKRTACVEDFRPRDCKDLSNQGFTRNGVYTLYPTKDMFIRAYCDMTTDTGGWTVFQRRINGRTDFYRSWQEYRDGFGNPADEYWLGNTYLYQLTNNRSCQLKIDFCNWDNITGYAKYEDFVIGHENDGFRLRIANYSGNAGFDGLALHNGMQFSTWDRDNNLGSPLSCAQYHKGAWWYNFCIASNLNGDYNKHDHTGVLWSDYPSSIHMKETTMLLRCD